MTRAEMLEMIRKDAKMHGGKANCRRCMVPVKGMYREFGSFAKACALAGVEAEGRGWKGRKVVEESKRQRKRKREVLVCGEPHRDCEYFVKDSVCRILRRMYCSTEVCNWYKGRVDESDCEFGQGD